MEPLTDAYRHAVQPALSLLPPVMGHVSAHILLLAIGLQESELTHRVQIGGPAKGLWQFEQGGGVRGVLRHPASARLAALLCRVRGLLPAEAAVYAALEHDDILAAGFARLLLWTAPAFPTPSKLPETASAGWNLYASTWRPGKPHPEKWGANYAAAEKAVMR